MAAEVPWWSNLVAILGTAVVSVLGTVYFIKGATGPAVSGPPGIGALIKETMLYLPHIMLLFGVLADMFTMQGVYSIPSIIGLLSIFVSGFVLKYFWTGISESIGYVARLLAMRKTGTSAAQEVNPFKDEKKGPTPLTEGAFQGTRAKAKGTTALPAAASKGGAPITTSYDGCTVQGFSKFQSPYAPQTLVVTATVFWYYIIDLIVNKGAGTAATSLAFFFVFYIGQMFLVGECAVDGTQINRWIRGIIAMAEGALIGGSGFALVAAYYPTKLPTAVLPLFPPKDPADLIPDPDGSGSLTDPVTGQKFKLINGIPMPDMCESAGGGDALSGIPGLPGVCPSNSAAPAAKTAAK